MIGLGKQLFGGRGLHHAAQVHDHHTVGQMPHHAQIMADEQIGEIQFFSQRDEQVQYLRLDGYIECRNRFIADQEIGFHGERARDADTCALATGELMGEAARQRRIKPDALHHLGNVGRFVFAADQSVHHGRLADDVLHAVTGVQRGIRVLENHLHFELHGTLFRRRHRSDILAAPASFTACLRMQAHHHPAECGFSAARFADQPYDLAFAYRQVDPVDRVYRFLTQVRTQGSRQLAGHIEFFLEALGNLFQLQQRCAHAVSSAAVSICG